MDFNFFEDTINKNIETDKASDKFDRQLQAHWRKRSIPTHSGWLYPLTFDAGKGLKEA